MTKMNRAVRTALVTIAALSGGVMTLASAQTKTSTMPMTNAKGGSTLRGNTPYTPTRAQCMTAKYRSSTACKAMMMKGRVQTQRTGAKTTLPATK